MEFGVACTWGWRGGRGGREPRPTPVHGWILIPGEAGFRSAVLRNKRGGGGVIAYMLASDSFVSRSVQTVRPPVYLLVNDDFGPLSDRFRIAFGCGFATTDDLTARPSLCTICIAVYDI
jgi:hypothetical protein